MLCSRIDETNIWDPLAWESENTTSLSYWEIHFNLDSSRKKLFPPKILNTSSLNSFEKKKTLKIWLYKNILQIKLL